MKYFIGLFAHSSSSTFAVMDQEGKCVLRKTVDTSEKKLLHVIEGIQGERILTFEESTISQWLYISIREKVDRLLVCNPTYVTKKSGARTDFRDALHLANELWDMIQRVEPKNMNLENTTPDEAKIKILSEVKEYLISKL